MHQFQHSHHHFDEAIEIGLFLTQKKRLEHFAAVAGSLEYRRRSPAPSITIGILQEYIQDTRSSWDYTLDSLRDYFDHVAVQEIPIAELPFPSGSLVDLQKVEIPELAAQSIGTYLTSAHLLGQRTAELHIALTSEPENPDFAPEPFSSFYQRSIYQQARNLAGQVLIALRQRLKTLTPHAQELAQDVLNRQEEIMGRFQLILNQKITAMRTRCHGDYHLGQVLYTGKDFIIADFEGESGRSLSDRRLP